MITGFENLLGEFMGTMVLMVFGVGVNANLNLEKSYAKGAGWICTAWGWGLAVLLGVFTSTAFGAPQADLNPSVTFAETYLGTYDMANCIATSVIQMLGGIVGSIIVYLAFLGHWSETKGSKLGIFSTNSATGGCVNGFISEFIATFFLMFIIIMIFSTGMQGPTGMPVGFGPYCVGLLIIAIGLSLGGCSGYAMNMARDLGPRIAHAILPIPDKGDGNWGYAWVPCIAPICGAVFAAVVATAFGVHM